MNNTKQTIPLYQKEYKEELEKELPDDMYNISPVGKSKIFTGKGGYIEYSIIMQSELIKYLKIDVDNNTSLTELRNKLKILIKL